MPDHDLKDEDWETLIFSIRQHNCILMLGPESSLEIEDEKPCPLTEILANQLAEKIDPEVKKKINTSDLSQVSQCHYMKTGKMDLLSKVCAFYNSRKKFTSDLHKNLAALPFYFTITTIPDNMFCEALLKENKNPVIERYNFNGRNPGRVEMGTVEKPLVFYLYGTIEEPESLLLTENDLLDYLVALISKKSPMPDNILCELRERNKSFLFIGFGFRHWYLRILLHVLQGRNKESRSFAMEQFKPENPAKLEQTIFFFKNSDYKIYIFQDKLSHFVKRLREKYQQSSSDFIPLGEKINDTKSPLVFICYSKEDREKALAIEKKLEESGIIPWVDENNLRGGEDWDIEIRKTIKKVDYFVVLQSQSLLTKRMGYVYREINAALDRLNEFKKGTPFIIPVKIEECPSLEELTHLQSIDLIAEGNIKNLVTMISRDFKKRANL